ncbi:bacteriocin immunity protein [Lactobacillus intestinalis]|uniref:bacteriocin immunity protein n=1 Tax=Lactobacillus intestinalis TaxID=151781 RepID=UPI001F2C9E51|nr:bacteriocin immunity protein [Lactobacillus intestinalis]
MENNYEAFMFGRKKQARIQKQLLNQIDEILRDPNIKDVERKSLKRVKTRLEKGEYL